ncbi:polymorphic toxin type 30 domain-containing protein [Hamadaea tsunoensis]|uniref:polymorphic toxin type 30 domain-containing protein n=1 Tax=Hamadaea tsunoensis TaxID=53368 RepID=UPI000415EE64|nr:polymorphic toxin type 30 domain-containing protein [Hamadaea tsunoensis]
MTRRTPGNRRAWLAAAISGVLAAGLLPLWQEPAHAAPRTPSQQTQTTSRVTLGSSKPAHAPATTAVSSFAAKTPVWPAAGSATADLRATAAVKMPRGVMLGNDVPLATGKARAGSLPVTIGSRGARKINVQMLGHDAATAAGRDVLFHIKTADASAAPVAVSLDISGFAGAYGADWSDRVRLATLPACGLSTPGAAGCAPTAVPTTRSADGAVLTATVASADTMMTLLSDTGSAGGTGTFAATSLSSSSTWSAGGNSGGFSWNYQMRVPPSLGGPTPNVSLNYSSQGVDGRTSASNNQPSWVGEGFDYTPGYIERRYVSCNDDKSGTHNNTTDTYDECWGTNNATLMLNGHGGELLYNSSDHQWHLRSEDGSKIEHLTGAVNGDSGDSVDGVGEYWVVTTTDGTKYYFGLNRLQGWTSGKPETNSVQTEPVYGNHPADACYNTSYAASSCVEAYRWNLDYVVDTHGNTMSLWWKKDTNKYGRNMSTTDLVSYDRDAYLDRIDYGTDQRTLVGGVKTDTEFTGAPVAMQVKFDVADRCLANCWTGSPATPVKASWSDTPWDLSCTASPCDAHSPSFFSSHRLSAVTTTIWDTTVTPNAPKNVEQWTLTHSYPDPTDGTRAGLWLANIGHQGVATGAAITGGTVTLPTVAFTPIMLDNRVDTALINGLRPMRWARMNQIKTESGGTITVSYAPTECVAGATPTPETNTKRCYPVRTAPEDLGGTPGQEIIDWFHKYVVAKVIQTDTTTPSSDSPHDVTTSYEYVGGAAWRYADDDGLTKDKYRTWNQWRGYDTVRTYVGVGTEQTRTDARYYRGMNGDRLNTAGGSKTVTLADSKGYLTGGMPDSDEYAGMLLENATYDSPTGNPLSGSVSKPWTSTATATRTIGGQTVTAKFTNTADTWAWSKLDGKTANPANPTPVDRVTHTHKDYDNAYGMETAVADDGDLAVTGDESCSLFDYVRNPSAYIMNAISNTRTYADTCTTAQQSGHVFSSDEVVSETHIAYDHQAWGTPPTIGEATQTDALLDWVNNAFSGITTSKVSYDAYGRTTDTWDVDNLHTSMVYTPASGAPVLTVDTYPPTPTGQAAWKSTATIEPAYGLTTASVDINSRRTDETYDAMGRLLAVWKPGRAKATYPSSPHIAYVYSVSDTAPSVVETRTLGPNANQISSYSFYDALMRPRQQQTLPADGSAGRVVTDTFYDSAGRAWRTYGPYVPVDTAAPSATLSPLPVDNYDQIDAWAKTLYDSAGRATDQVRYSRLTEQYRTSIRYPSADRVDTIPPVGGTATTAVLDAAGRTVELRQQHDRANVSVDPAGFDRTAYHFNAKGQQDKLTDAAGTQWSWQFDILGRVHQSVDPDHGTSTTDYYDDGRVKTTQDASGTLVYDYDSVGRQIGLYSGSKTAATQLSRWDYDGTSPTLANARGMKTASTRYVGGSSGSAYTTAITGLATNGLPSQQKITIPATETGLTGTYQYDMTYKADGSLATYRMPAIGNTTTNLGYETQTTAYTDLGQPQKLTTSSTTWLVTNTTYTALGQVGVITLRDQTADGQVQIGNYYQSTTGRLQRTWVTNNAGASVADTNYTYDAHGGITQIDETSSVAGAQTQCFATDYLMRLRDAWTPSNGDCSATKSVGTLGGVQPYWMHWDIDAAGNRSKQIDYKNNKTTNYAYAAPTASKPHAVTSTTNASGTVTGTYSYDAAGNTTCRPYAKDNANTCPATPTAKDQNLSWDVEGHLAQTKDTTGTTTYLYDADGNRLVRKDPLGKTLYLPGQELRVDTLGGSVTGCTRYYGWAGRNIAVRSTANGLNWMAADQQNTTNITIAAAGTQAVAVRHQDPFGNQLSAATGTWPSALDKGFVGGTNDNTGLVHEGAREYDPTIGRFVSLDPEFDKTNPQSFNGYSYADNSPILGMDPTGLHDECGGGTGTYSCQNPNGTISSNVELTPDEQKQVNTVLDTIRKNNENKKKQDECQKSFWCRNKANIAGFAVGAVVGLGCGALIGWTGVGAVACGAFAGAAASAVTGYMNGDGGLDLLKDAVIGAAFGAVTGGLFSMFGAGAGAAAGAATRPMAAFGDAFVGEFSNIVKGLTGKAAGSGLAGAGCHSFAASTPVLMADGSTKPIGEVKVGDKVLATDPGTGENAPKSVTQLHLNHDWDLADVTVKNLKSGQTTVLHTTWNHPFWNADLGTWSQAADLKPGDHLRDDDGNAADIVTSVRTWTGLQWMRDLTVADIHTYYVIAGNTPVLVHNCGGYDLRGKDPMSIVPDNASVRELTPHPNGGSQYGLEFKWTNDAGKTVRLRIHGPDGTAPAGSNSATGETYRVQIGRQYQDEAGNLFHHQSHNPNSPNYNADAANATHIPWPSQFPGL